MDFSMMSHDRYTTVARLLYDPFIVVGRSCNGRVHPVPVARHLRLYIRIRANNNSTFLWMHYILIHAYRMLVVRRAEANRVLYVYVQ